MKIIRWILGKVILFLNAVFSPTPKQRDSITQKKINDTFSSMQLYQYQACPFCVKVRRYLQKENVSIELIDAKLEKNATELIKVGGKMQVPCLRIRSLEKPEIWMYESNQIISFIKDQVAHLES